MSSVPREKPPSMMRRSVPKYVIGATQVWVEYLGNLNWYQSGEITQGMLEILWDVKSVGENRERFFISDHEYQSGVADGHAAADAWASTGMAVQLKAESKSLFMTAMWFEWVEIIKRVRDGNTARVTGADRVATRDGSDLPEAVSVEETKSIRVIWVEEQICC